MEIGNQYKDQMTMILFFDCGTYLVEKTAINLRKSAKIRNKMIEP